VNSQEITDVIRQRRTIKPKFFSSQAVDASLVDEILENANWAPTHGMTEPWRFTIFTGDARQQLADFLADTYKAITPPESFKQNKYEGMRVNPTLAPVVIAIAMNRQGSGKIPESDEMLAVACAVQNMHLTATAHGLGGFWSTNVAAVSDQMRQFLELEPKDRALGLFYLGYPEGDWPSGDRTPIDDKVTWRSR
jgi:nitroreductase